MGVFEESKGRLIMMLGEISATTQRVRNAPNSDGPVKLFISYSHFDERHRRELVKHLSPLLRMSLIEVWHDRKIEPGNAWEREISDALSEADILLMLVTPNFVASDYCYEVEFKTAMKRHQQEKLRVVPILVDHVDLTATPLASLQSLPPGGRSISQRNPHSRAWADVAASLRELVATIREER